MTPAEPDPHAPPDHVIRLRGPWAWAPDGGEPAPASLPHAAATAGVLVRQFNTPTGLEDGTRVRLRVDAERVDGVTLNGAAVEPGADVTVALGAAGSRCELAIALSPGATVSAAALALFEPRYAY